MKTTIDLPDELVRQIKIRAIDAGIPLKQLVAQILRQSLHAELTFIPTVDIENSEHFVLDKRGFPVIRCGSHASANLMTAEELIALEQKTILEEDMKRVSTSF